MRETFEFLRQGVGRPDVLFAAGDDAEKFGIWPGTYDLCYTRGWLEKFFEAIENAGDWLETTTLSAFMAANKPLGRVYLPTASYPEMMEWALPARACEEFMQCLEETERMPSGERFRKFLLGGTWQGFLGKYAESNQIHKLMLETSRRFHKAETGVPPASERRNLLDQAETHLLAAQCNDAYWHGLFGGLYSPHLRSAVLQNLIQAETLLDQLNGEAARNGVRVTQADFDVDGEQEILLSHRQGRPGPETLRRRHGFQPALQTRRCGTHQLTDAAARGLSQQDPFKRREPSGKRTGEKGGPRRASSLRPLRAALLPDLPFFSLETMEGF